MNGSVIWPTKSPSEVRFYGINWKKRLFADMFIVNSIWEYQEGLTVLQSGLSEEYPTITVIRISGGIHTKNYRLLNRIATSDGQLLEVVATLQVQTK